MITKTFVAYLVLIAFLSKRSKTESVIPRNVIVDVDVGTDDAWALKLLSEYEKQGDIKILGIVCSYGNAELNYIIRNVFMILELIGRLDIPVYAGASESIIIHKPLKPEFHGIDGLGDAGDYGIIAKTDLLMKENAVSFIHKSIIENSKQISYIALGPLTTLSLVLKTYSDVHDEIKEIFIMGGNDPSIGLEANKAEFNFLQDPESVDIVLRSVNCPITIFTWEASSSPNILIPMSWYLNLPANPINSAFVAFMRRIEVNVYGPNAVTWMPCDAFLVAAFLNSNIVEAQKNWMLEVELSDQEGRRAMLFDSSPSGSAVTVIERINQEMFENMILDSIKE